MQSNELGSMYYVSTGTSASICTAADVLIEGGKQIKAVVYMYIFVSAYFPFISLICKTLTESVYVDSRVYQTLLYSEGSVSNSGCE